MASTIEPPGHDDFEKLLESYIANEENSKEINKNASNEEDEYQVELTSINPSDDSEGDEYNLTEDQKRALEELDNLKTEMGYPDEDPLPYDVKERLKLLNEDLKNDPTPVEKQKDSKVGFKQNLVDLVVPPPAESDGDEDAKPNSPKLSKPPQKPSGDKVDDYSANITASKKSNSEKQNSVLIEKEGQFMLVNADDVRAKDLGYNLDHDKETLPEKEKHEVKKTKLQPFPPGKPRPATANSNQRNVRSKPVTQRPQSAQISSYSTAQYNSPYGLSQQEKKVMEERKKALEKQKQVDDRRKKEEEENKEKENHEAFEFWLKQKRESNKKKRMQEEEKRKKNVRVDKHQIKDFVENRTLTSYDIHYNKQDMDEQSENEEAYKSWLKEKNAQFKKEKLLKRRQNQEMHDGYYLRTREECDQAYRKWLKQKATEARKAKALEQQKAKLQRLAAKRARQSISLSKSIQESQSFRYVDYYGYSF